MNFVYAFLVCGAICLIGQLLIDVFKFLPVHVVVSFVIIGALLELVGVYDTLIEIANMGAVTPISSFGHSLAHATVDSIKENGYLGVIKGMFDMTNGGIVVAIVGSFLASFIFKPRG